MSKHCNDCKLTKSFSEFYEKNSRLSLYGSDSPSSYSHTCKTCTKATRELYVINNSEKARLADKNAYLKRKYGIDLAYYNQMFINQNGCCATCETHQSELNRTLCVDHNHETGEVRGLLCMSCNRAFGLLKENVNTLKNLITYKLKPVSAVVNTEQEKAG